MDTHTLIPPIPNLNGSSRADLAEQYGAVVYAATNLREAMSACVPHGRDYPMAPVNAALAREAHFEFYRIVTELQSQYVNIFIDLKSKELLASLKGDIK